MASSYKILYLIGDVNTLFAIKNSVEVFEIISHMRSLATRFIKLPVMQASRDDPSSANLVLLMHELIILIENDQVDDFKRLSAETIHMWNTTNTKSGLKLILEAIKSNR